MTLKEFVAKGWQDHQDDAKGVLGRLPDGAGLVTDAADLPGLAGLIVHVAGEHCGQWGDGLRLLQTLAEHDAFDGESAAGKSVCRSMATLHYCAGAESEFEAALERGSVGPESRTSERVRTLAIAASALAGQRRTADATQAFTSALDLASYGPDKSDPAARALAVTGNNLASDLEEKADRTEDEARLMLQAAQAARRFWEIAGDWMNVERAEYRLAMTHLQLGDAATALAHAQLCLDVCQENEAPPGETYFAHEALAKASHLGGDGAVAKAHRDRAAECAAQVKDDDFRSFCEGELAELDIALA